MSRKRTGTAFRRGERWVARITLHREPKTESGKHPWHELSVTRADGKPITKNYARDFVRRAQERYDEGTWQPPRAVTPTERETVLEWCTRWLAKKTYPSVDKDRSRVAQWLPRTRFAQLAVDAVTPQDCASFVEQLAQLPSPRSKKPPAPRTLRNILDPVQRALRGAVFEQRLAADPFASLPTELRPQAKDADPAARAGYRLSQTEVRSLLTDPGVEDRWQVLWWIVVLSGVRIGEAIALRWSDLRADTPLQRLVVSGQIALGSTERTPTKTRTVREIPVHPELAAKLLWWKAEGWLREYGRVPIESDLLVPAHAERGRETAPTAGGPLRHQSAYRALQRDLEGCGIESHRIHDLRHTFISLCADAGIAADVAERWTHAPSGTSARRLYLAPSWARQCDEMTRLRIVE